MPAEGGIAQRVALVDVVSGLLDKGTVISGQATVSVAGVDLVHVALNLLVSSVETLRQSNPMRTESPLSPPRSLSPGTALHQTEPHAQANLSPLWSGPSETGALLLQAPAAPASPHLDAEAQHDQGLAGLVLALVELIRQLLERQAVRRMEGGALTEDEVERMGRALMELHQKMQELFAIFGISEGDVNLDLGPLGQLL